MIQNAICLSLKIQIYNQNQLLLGAVNSYWSL